MPITDKSDEEIIGIAAPMIDNIVKASNEKDWALFSKYQTLEIASDPENRKSVERQWEESDLLTSLILEREILGVLRRDEEAVVYWKQTSKKVPGEYLATYHIKEIGSEVKEVGFLIV